MVTVLCTAFPVAARTTTTRFVRTSLEDTPARPIEPNAPRVIRSNLDQPGHAAFTLHAGASRFIRVTLDDASEPHGRLDSAELKARYVRMSLD